jgi:hypothetical protein
MQNTKKSYIYTLFELFFVSLRIDILLKSHLLWTRPILPPKISHWRGEERGGECEGGNQEEEKFCLFHFAFMDTGERNSSRI